MSRFTERERESERVSERKKERGPSNANGARLLLEGLTGG